MEQYRVNRVWVDDAHIWAETQMAGRLTILSAVEAVLLTPHLPSVRLSY